MRCTVVMYHYIRDPEKTPYKGINSLRVEEFKKQLAFFKQNYSVIGMNEYFNYLESEQKVPDNSLILTFDDGVKEIHNTVFPLLKKEGFSGCFFPITRTLEGVVPAVQKIHFLLCKINSKTFAENVNKILKEKFPEKFEKFEVHDRFKINPQKRFDDNLTANLKHNLAEMPESIKNCVLNSVFSQHFDEKTFCEELYVNKSEIKEMYSAGMEFGGHTHTHPLMASLNDEEQEIEIKKSTELLKNILGKVDFFSYPYGSFNDTTMSLLKKYHYKGAVTIDLGVNEGRINPFLIKRMNCNDFK